MADDNKREENTRTALELVERPREVQARFELVISKPDILERILEHIANGGSLVSLCRMWVISYRKMMNWINKQEGGREAYAEAIKQRGEWAEEMTLSDLHNYAQADIRDVFDANGEMVNPAELEDHIAPAVDSIEVKTRYLESGEKEITHKIKLVDKLKTRDMLLKTQGKYVDKTEHSGSINLLDIIVGSTKK